MRLRKTHGTVEGRYGSAFANGVLGAVVMSILMALARWMDGTDLNLEYALGSLLTEATYALRWTLGFIWHLVNGGIFALAYAWGFKTIRRADMPTGVMFGAIHSVAALAVFWSLDVTDRGGAFEFLETVVLHLVYGGVVGSEFEQSVHIDRNKTDFTEELLHKQGLGQVS